VVVIAKYFDILADIPATFISLFSYKPDEFQEMFLKCKIGGPDISEDLKKNILAIYSLLTNRLINDFIWRKSNKYA